MTDHATYEPTPPEDTTPEDETVPATLEWLMDLTHRHVLEVTKHTEMAVMAAVWALGFSGSSRLQVWWVLRDERLRRAYGSTVRALLRVGDAPSGWAAPVAALPTPERVEVARRVDCILADQQTSVPDSDDVLFAICSRHPEASMAQDGRTVTLPRGGFEDLAAAARAVTPADVARLLAHARKPFQDRLDEAARVSGDATTAFHVRRRRRVA